MGTLLGSQGPNLLQPRLLPARLSVLLAVAGVLMALAAGIRWHGAATAQEQAELDLEALQMVNAADRDKPGWCRSACQHRERRLKRAQGPGRLPGGRLESSSGAT